MSYLLFIFLLFGAPKSPSGRMNFLPEGPCFRYIHV